MSRVLRATPLMLSEQGNILASTEKPTTSKADPQTEVPTAPRQGNPGSRHSRVTLARAIWYHLHSDDSCGFQWRDVDAVTPEFNLDLQNTSPEYFRHREHLVFCVIEGVMKMLYLQDVRLRPTHGCKEHQGLHRHQWNQQSHVAFVHSGSRHHS